MAETNQLHPVMVRVAPRLFKLMNLAATLENVSANTIAARAIAAYCEGLSLNVKPTDMQRAASETLRRMRRRNLGE